MSSVARRIEADFAQGEVGTVARIERGVIVVATDRGEVRATRAVSCLVAPVVSDLVLVALRDRGTNYVLAVLERTGDDAVRLEVDGDLSVHLPNGNFRVAAQHGVDLTSAERVSVTSSGVDVRAVEANVVLERLSAIANLAHVDLERLKLVAASVESVLERWVQRVKRSYRTVEHLDHVRAGQIDHAARDGLSLRGRNAMLTAEELVKLDAEQIHLG